MTKKTPPFQEHPKWTEAKFFAFLRSALRQAWNKWPPKYRALERQTVPYRGEDKRRKKSIVCEHCQQKFKASEVQVDHIIACGSLRSFEDLPGFAERLFVSEDKLQVLCKPCHQEKDDE